MSVPAGEGVIKGWETDGTWAVTQGLDFIFGAGNLTSITQTGLLARNVPVDTNYRVFGKYTFSAGLPGLYVGLGVQHTGPRGLNSAATFYLPQYTIATALSDTHGRHWQAQVNVNNLFNRNYPAFGISTTGIMAGNPLDGFVLGYLYIRIVPPPSAAPGVHPPCFCPSSS